MQQNQQEQRGSKKQCDERVVEVVFLHLHGLRKPKRRQSSSAKGTKTQNIGERLEGKGHRLLGRLTIPRKVTSLLKQMKWVL